MNLPSNSPDRKTVGSSLISYYAPVIDLVFVCTPASANPELLRACARKGISAAFLTSAGYGEAGDAAEQAFVKMLAGPKPDAALQSGPWFSAVFGRGRALGAWPAEGFGEEQIDEVCGFLLGACSCEVKRMNPGWDLLLRADWDAELAAAEQARISASGDPEALPAPSVVPETVTFEPRASRPPVTPVNQQRLTLRLLAASFAFVALAAVLGKLLAPR